MPDTRSHRGAHPEDAGRFAREHWPALQRAGSELAWLLDRGYALRSSLALVGDRHTLTQRQRLAVARCVSSLEQCQRRDVHEVAVEAVRGAELWIDGYNLLITVEAALGGGVILEGRDRCFRDLASLHGTYRTVSETEPALTLIGETFAGWAVARCRWILDQPVSNSGRLKATLLALGRAHGWDWDVELAFSPDKLLGETSSIIASSDSVVLDRCSRWFNAAREIVAARVPTAYVVELTCDPRRA